MKFTRTIAATLLATLLQALAPNAFAGGGTAAASATLGRYSFDYAIVGEGRSRPLQVFDSGEKTYLQFSREGDIPAFFSADGSRQFLPTLEGPYAVINATPRDFIAQMGLSRTRITHASLLTNAVQSSPAGAPVLPQPGAPAQQLAVAANARIQTVVVPNGWMQNTYAQPRRGDVIEWVPGAAARKEERRVAFDLGESKLTREAEKATAIIAASIPAGARVVIVGRDDDSYKEGLGQARARAIKKALMFNGVAEGNISEITATASDSDIRTEGKTTRVVSAVRWDSPLAVAELASDPARRDVGQMLASGAITPSQAMTALRSNTAGAGALPPPPPAPAPEPTLAAAPKWAVRKADGTVASMLRRWGDSAGWKVLDQGAPEIPILGDEELERASFIDAAEYALKQAKAAGYRLLAESFPNKVLVLSTEKEGTQ